MLKKTISQLQRILSIALMSAFCIGGISAQDYPIKVEAEDYTEGYKTENLSIEQQTSSPYSGDYTLVTGDEGEPMLPISVTAGGTYTIRAWYHGGSNTYYNLYDSDAATKLSNDQDNANKINDLAVLGYFDYPYDLEADKTYYFGIYGNTGTIYDYVEVLDSQGDQVLKVEAETFSEAYKPENITVMTPVSYSNDEYTIVTGDEGEAAVRFSVPTTGTHTIKVYYHGGSNTFYNLYDSGMNKLSDDQDNVNKIPDLSALGYYEFNFDLEAGIDYYIGVYGNTGTIYDCAEITLQTTLASDETPDDAIQAEDVEFGAGASRVPTVSGCERTFVRIANYHDSGSEYVRFPFTVAADGLYNIYVGYLAPDGDGAGRVILDGVDNYDVEYTFLQTEAGDCPLEVDLLTAHSLTAGDHEIDLTVFESTNNIYIDYLRVVAYDPNTIGKASETAEGSVTCNGKTVLVNVEGNFEYALYNSVGSLVEQGESAGAATIDVQNLPAGIYIVNVNVCGKQFSKKISVF